MLKTVTAQVNAQNVHLTYENFEKSIHCQINESHQGFEIHLFLHDPRRFAVPRNVFCICIFSDSFYVVSIVARASSLEEDVCSPRLSLCE